jgi:hypothetical protein
MAGCREKMVGRDFLSSGSSWLYHINAREGAVIAMPLIKLTMKLKWKWMRIHFQGC